MYLDALKFQMELYSLKSWVKIRPSLIKMVIVQNKNNNKSQKSLGEDRMILCLSQGKIAALITF